MARIPAFKNLEEEQEFWQTHTMVDYLDDMEDVSDEEVATINAEAQARRVMKALLAVREELGEDVAEALQAKVLDLVDQRCREKGTTLADILSRKKVA